MLLSKSWDMMKKNDDKDWEILSFLSQKCDCLEPLNQKTGYTELS